MRVKCNIDYCKHWKDDAGDYIGEGGCTLDEIEINDDELTGGGFFPMCKDYEEERGCIKAD